MGGSNGVARESALRDQVEEVRDALVVPPPKGAKNAPSQRSGVFDAGGRFVAASMTMRPTGPFNAEPPRPPESEVEALTGRWMFGGTMFGHFGHFLMDSLARVWAFDGLRDRIEGVLFTPKTNGGNPENMLKVQLPLMRALGLDAPVRLVTEPTRVETLFVPYQGIGIGQGWETGTEAFRAYMARFGGKGIAPRGPERIYLSRSALPKARASFLSEAILERHLAAAGYAVVHPQTLSKEEQVALYRAARWIVSPDGSPLHLLAYVGHRDQSVAVIARRSADTHSLFEAQLAAFTGARAITVDCLVNDWVVAGGRPGRTSWGELDLPGVHRRLRDAGFLPEGTPPWPPATEEEVASEIRAIGAREGAEYVRWGPPTRPPG